MNKIYKPKSKEEFFKAVDIAESGDMIYYNECEYELK